jgi:DICT domain-containing protein
MAGDMWHIVILTQHAARRNPLRESFHTVCLRSAQTAGLRFCGVRTTNPRLALEGDPTNLAT